MNAAHSKVCIIPQKFRTKTWGLLYDIIAICEVLYERGYVLTLRQLYYQLVSRNLIENTDRSYTNLGNLVRDARYAGVLDWRFITDHVRVLRDSPRWADAEDRIVHAAEVHRIDTWLAQRYRPEVWIEKAALLQLAENACRDLDVPFMEVKAYSSVSALWEARARFREYASNGQTPVILHLGDHDSTGDDCSRFLRERMELMVNTPALDKPVTVGFRRLALNRDQIEKYELPPQPGKVKDPRFKGYVAKHGTTYAWELDALDPQVIENLIEGGIREFLDEDLRQLLLTDQEEQRASLKQVGRNWKSTTEYAAFADAISEYNHPESNGLQRKLSIPNFLPPVATDKDAEIAEEYAEQIYA